MPLPRNSRFRSVYEPEDDFGSGPFDEPAELIPTSTGAAIDTSVGSQLPATVPAPLTITSEQANQFFDYFNRVFNPAAETTPLAPATPAQVAQVQQLFNPPPPPPPPITWLQRAQRDYPNFDASGYAARYPDLAAAFGNDTEQLAAHWLNSGISEGRDPSAYTAPAPTANTYSAKATAITPNFDVEGYAARYPELAAAYGGDRESLAMHWVTVGKNEGRDPSAYTAPAPIATPPAQVAAAPTQVAATPAAVLSSGGSGYGGGYDSWLAVAPQDVPFDPYDYWLANDLKYQFAYDPMLAVMHWADWGQYAGAYPSTAARTATEKAEADRVAREKAEADLAAAAKIERDKVEAAKQEAANQEAARIEAAKAVVSGAKLPDTAAPATPAIKVDANMAAALFDYLNRLNNPNAEKTPVAPATPAQVEQVQQLFEPPKQPEPAPAPPPYVPFNPVGFDWAGQGTQIVTNDWGDKWVYQPNFTGGSQGTEGQPGDPGILTEITRYRQDQTAPGQYYEVLDPATGKVTGYGQFQESSRGFFGDLFEMVGAVAKDLAPIALMAVGIPGSGLAAALGGSVASTLGIAGLSAAQTAALGTAVANAAVTAVQGGDVDDVIKSAIGGGLGSLATGKIADFAKGIGAEIGGATGDIAREAITGAGRALPGAITSGNYQNLFTGAIAGAVGSGVGQIADAVLPSKITSYPNVDNAILKGVRDLASAATAAGISGQDVNLVQTLIPSIAQGIADEYKLPINSVRVGLQTASKLLSGAELTPNDVLTIGRAFGTSATPATQETVAEAEDQSAGYGGLDTGVVFDPEEQEKPSLFPEFDNPLLTQEPSTDVQSIDITQKLKEAGLEEVLPELLPDPTPKPITDLEQEKFQEANAMPETPQQVVTTGKTEAQPPEELEQPVSQEVQDDIRSILDRYPAGQTVTTTGQKEAELPETMLPETPPAQPAPTEPPGVIEGPSTIETTGTKLPETPIVPLEDVPTIPTPDLGQNLPTVTPPTGGTTTGGATTGGTTSTPAAQSKPLDIAALLALLNQGKSETQYTTYNPVIAQLQDLYDLEKLFSVGQDEGVSIEDLLNIIGASRRS